LAGGEEAACGREALVDGGSRRGRGPAAGSGEGGMNRPPAPSDYSGYKFRPQAPGTSFVKKYYSVLTVWIGGTAGECRLLFLHWLWYNFSSKYRQSGIYNFFGGGCFMALHCFPVNPHEITLPCGSCGKCLGRSKLDYPFPRDLFNSNDFVRELMKFIEETTGFECKPTTINKNPDIDVFDQTGALVCRVEAKYLEGQAFMSAWKFVKLFPREALAVDEPKLHSYFERKAADGAAGQNIPIFVVWQYDRPCSDIGGITVFQEIDVLKQIYSENGPSRAFERKSSFNDYSNGTKLGITKKYHFSIRECEPIEELPKRILALR